MGFGGVVELVTVVAAAGNFSDCAGTDRSIGVAAARVMLAAIFGDAPLFEFLFNWFRKIWNMKMASNVWKILIAGGGNSIF